MDKPRVFIGSASETREIVDALEAGLRDVAFIERWDVDVFRPGHFTLDELTKAVREVDFAIFVLGQDDITESRGGLKPSPRDNVVFEAGLFTAVLGRERTFYVVDHAGTKIPTDWAGLGYLLFDASQQRPRDMVYDTTASIREQISTWQPTKGLGPLAGILGAWWQLVVNVDEGAILSWLELTASEPAHLQLAGTAWSKDGALRARYRSRSAHFEGGNLTLYYSWEGEHPREQAIPRFYGVGEVAFRGAAGGTASGADGWFSSSSSTDVKDATIKATTYFRPTAEELSIMRSADVDKRAALIQAKLMEREKINA